MLQLPDVEFHLNGCGNSLKIPRIVFFSPSFLGKSHTSYHFALSSLFLFLLLPLGVVQGEPNDDMGEEKEKCISGMTTNSGKTKPYALKG